MLKVLVYIYPIHDESVPTHDEYRETCCLQCYILTGLIQPVTV